MIQLCGACSGLVVFSAMIVRGMLVGNPPQTVILRALIGLVGALVLGQLVGWIGAILVRDNLPESPNPNESEASTPNSPLTT